MEDVGLAAYCTTKRILNESKLVVFLSKCKRFHESDHLKFFKTGQSSWMIFASKFVSHLLYSHIYINHILSVYLAAETFTRWEGHCSIIASTLQFHSAFSAKFAMVIRLDSQQNWFRNFGLWSIFMKLFAVWKTITVIQANKLSWSGLSFVSAAQAWSVSRGGGGRG